MKLSHLGWRGVAAILPAVLLTLVASVAGGAELLSSPAEQIETEKLNCNILQTNALADDRYRSVAAQYQQQKGQNDQLTLRYKADNELLREQYEALRANYAKLEAQYRTQKEQADEAQQQYRDLEMRYRGVNQTPAVEMN